MSSDRAIFLKDFARAIHEESAAIFVGAGTSAAAGYPTWKQLLKEIAEELHLELEDLDDLAAIAQWSILENGHNRTRVLDTISRELSPLRAIPSALKVVARLPLKHVWTTNFDRLLERAFEEVGRPVDARFAPESLSLRQVVPGAVRIYKMHGSIDNPHSLVISTEDFELYRQGRAAFMHMLQAQLASRTFLFCGISLTDPNMKHVLGAIREHFPQTSPTHFLIARRPSRAEFSSDEMYEARLARHGYWAKDLRRYGFRVLEVSEYAEIDVILEDLERHVARQRAWISGSWPASVTHDGVDVAYVESVAEAMGSLVADLGLTLVSGSGLLVGPQSMRGFLNSLQVSGSWDLERRLVVRPFPQPNPGAAPNRKQWAMLRDEMARLSGVMIVVGGLKLEGASVVRADGVLAEVALIQERGGFVLPIGATGGAAREVARSLIGSSSSASGRSAVRPTDDELHELSVTGTSIDEVVAIVKRIIIRMT